MKMKKGLIGFMTLSIILSMGGILFGGVTGKIMGRITDKDNDDPLYGSNIFIEETTLGAAADADGYYTILNVSPGVHTIRVSMMGYQTVIVEDVRVNIDQTSTINLSLTPTVLETPESITIVAERPLVRKDMTSSLASVSGNEIGALPVETVDDVLELQAGIIRSGSSGEDLHIRGGRSGEIAFWVDGVAVTDVYDGNMGVVVENSSIQELQVISGTFNAEYGQAMSGIINIITNEGGKKYSGYLKAYFGDFLSWGEEFKVLESVKTTTDPETNTINTVGKMENPLIKLNPIYNGEFSLSGPFPLLKNKLSFFLNGRHFYNEGYLYGREWFKPTGVPGDSTIVPLNPYQRTSAQAKLTFKPSSNIKINYGVFWNQWENETTYWLGLRNRTNDLITGHEMRYVPGGLPTQKSNGLSHIVTWNHVLSPNTFYEIRLNRFHSEYERYVFENVNAAPKYYVHVDSTTYSPELILDLSIPADSALFDSITQNRIPYEYLIDPNGPVGYVDPDSLYPPISNSFYRIGMDMRHSYRSTSYWLGKFDLTSQINRIHQIKTGFEFRLYELELDDFTLIPKVEGGEEVKPFTPAVPDVSTIYHDVYNRKPIEAAAYIQDKIEFNDIILNIGLRFDYFDAKASIPKDPEDTNIYNPFKDEYKYKNPNEPVDSLKIAYTPEERESFMLKPVDPKYRISPRLGIAYPITDRGVIHFSYGHFYQIPEFQYLYASPDYKFTSGGGGDYRLFGNPDLKPQQTIMYEIGLQQQLTDDIGMDITLFYRDVRNWVGVSPLITTHLPDTKYSMYENKDYANVRGITLKLEKRYANHFAAKLDYTYQVAEGTFSDPTDAFYAFENQDEPRRILIPMLWDQPHTLNASVVIGLGGWNASLIGRYWSGKPYTPEWPSGEMTGVSAATDLRENSARLPSQQSVDLYIDRTIPIGKLKVTLFLNIYNLFDHRDETDVYGDTGTASYTTLINPAKIPYNPLRVGTIEHYVLQSGWYTSPREVHAGVEINF